MEDPSVSKKSHKISPKEGAPGPAIGKVMSFFQWVAIHLGGRGKEEKVEGETEQRKRLLSRYPLGELVAGGERSIGKLEEARSAFLDKVGRAGAAFVSRHVDPVMHALNDFVLSLKEDTEIGEAQSGMRGALGTVELIALARDEHRPWKKIREGTEYQGRQALLEDVAFLMTYPAELLSHMGVGGEEQASTLKKIEEALHPVLLKFEKLLSKHPISDDFYALYSWRSLLDVERQQLHDTALKYIEEHVAHYKLKFSIRDESFFWLGQPIEALSFEEYNEAFQYIFELVKSSEAFRSDERVIRFFNHSKEYLHSQLHSHELSEEEQMRLLQTIRLIEELIGAEEE